MIKENLSPNELYVLDCISQSIPTVNVNLHVEIRALVRDGWITDETLGKGYKYSLTPKATTLLSTFGSTKPKELTVNILDNITKYLDMFPRGKLPSGKPARSDKKNLENNFKWFFNNFSYSWDTIFKATAYYVDEFEKVNYLYMRTSQYFIRKREDGNNYGSELANYCSIIESGDDIDTNNHFKQNVV